MAAAGGKAPAKSATVAYDMVSSKSRSRQSRTSERAWLRGRPDQPSRPRGASGAALQQQPDVLEGVLHEQLHEEQRADLRGELLDAAVRGEPLPVAADLEQVRARVVGAEEVAHRGGGEGERVGAAVEECKRAELLEQRKVEGREETVDEGEREELRRVVALVDVRRAMVLPLAERLDERVEGRLHQLDGERGEERGEHVAADGVVEVEDEPRARQEQRELQHHREERAEAEHAPRGGEAQQRSDHV